MGLNSFSRNGAMKNMVQIFLYVIVIKYSKTKLFICFLRCMLLPLTLFFPLSDQICLGFSFCFFSFVFFFVLPAKKIKYLFEV